MKQRQLVASGSAVLNALVDEPSSVPGGSLDFFVPQRFLGEEGLFECHEFMRGEGYSLVDESFFPGRESYDEVMF
ncbi:hypothetical protein T10_10080 [Trichinella papuae]|uniref:Uncharacterized protein n=1 Tax=Trichinella papuae TaxID=268474 RepID=A0A0V1LXE6_9BILA|nr:hypothetical protein T10_10080 [Trichinella papuae]